MGFLGLFGPPDVDKMKDSRDVDGLIKALGYQKDSDIRRDAARALREIGDPRAVDPLIAALEDSDSDVRTAAADALDRIGWEPDRGVSGAAYWIARREWDHCVEIGTPAVEPLIAALKDEDVRRTAVEALGAIGDVRAVEPLSAALKDEDVRRTAVEALGAIGAPAVEPLIDALEHEDDCVREYASQTLGRMGEPAAEALNSIIKGYGEDPLLWAVEHGHLEVVTLLLDYGADVNARDDEAHTALHYAAKGQPEMAALLLDRGADVDARTDVGLTPLAIAAIRAEYETILLLIERGADVNAQCKYCFTVLDYAHEGVIIRQSKILRRYKMGALPPEIQAVLDAFSSHIRSGRLPSTLEILLTHGAEGNATTMEHVRNPLKYLDLLKDDIGDISDSSSTSL